MNLQAFLGKDDEGQQQVGGIPVMSDDLECVDKPFTALSLAFAMDWTSPVSQQPSTMICPPQPSIVTKYGEKFDSGGPWHDLSRMLLFRG